ncbi:MAG TPA: hypothetical protein VFI20_03005 [Terracidiphilus sp.]|nr:hypothetical protein [Terracidiphilus sp.]
MWVWFFGGLGTYLVLEFGLFLLFALALKKSAAELAGPYLACAMPVAIFIPLAWRLWQREKQNVSPKRLAREWGVSAVLWGIAVVVAVIYSGVKLRYMDPKYAFGGLVVSLLFCLPIGYFTLYRMTLKRIAPRVAGDRDRTHTK